MAVATKSIKFTPALKELRIHLCQKSSASAGIREFVEKHYIPLKAANPKFPILIRECSGITPKLWARYDYLQRNGSISFCDLKVFGTPTFSSWHSIKHVQIFVFIFSVLQIPTITNI